MSPIQSIYIPRVSAFVTEDIIIEQLANIGDIRRVDFAPLGKKPGFVEENVDKNVKSAFVHFFDTFECPVTSDINTYGSHKFYPYFGGEYWILLKVKNPIQDTMMNNAQIVENCRLLEKKVEEQAATIKAMEKKVDGLQHVVYQLLGGLFNQQTQQGILDSHLSILFNNINQDNEDIDPEENNWPTTRQGDENEKRIEALETQLLGAIDALNNHAEKGTAMEIKFNSLDNQVKEMTNFDYNEVDEAFKPYEYEYTAIVDTLFKNHQYVSEDDNSTHSSMPDLIGDSDNDSDSIPDLESVSSSGSSQRLRNTFELCGNE